MTISEKVYREKVYAGVLGKIIGVYMGQAFEGWTHEQIVNRFGIIRGYVNEQLGFPLVVTDDDIAGTFTFIKALEDHTSGYAITAEQIGNTWLNYIIENKSIFWWGGMNQSTEHTAYLRLKSGVKAPYSGSAQLNGAWVAEQIGAQIFIDAWAMVCPEDPESATRLAEQAGKVSHDGNAVEGAKMIAAIESLSFGIHDMNFILKESVRYINPNAHIYAVIQQVQEWAAKHDDWRDTFGLIRDQYGYDRYPGICHVIPNHAVVIMSLCHSNNNFLEGLSISNTVGWDTDCNAATVGCILGIKNGISSLTDQRALLTPVHDRLYLSTAEGGDCINDATRVATRIINIRQQLIKSLTYTPKQGARFHFSFPESLQGFDLVSEETTATVHISNEALPNNISDTETTRALKISWRKQHTESPLLIGTPAFIPPQDLHMPRYHLEASPSLYPGQTVIAYLQQGDDALSVGVGLFIQYYAENDEIQSLFSPIEECAHTPTTIKWTIPFDTPNPIFHVGVAVYSPKTASIFLDSLDWTGTPNTRFERPQYPSDIWPRMWVNAVDIWNCKDASTFSLSQNFGIGIVSTGTRQWTDYEVHAELYNINAKAAGLIFRYQGLRRFYSMELSNDGALKLVKHYDDIVQLLYSLKISLKYAQKYQLQAKVFTNHIQCYLDNQKIWEYNDTNAPLLNGGIGLKCQEGHLECSHVRVM